jgi:lipoprotein-anchoring transpeptidase ErfK/SrfK
MREAQPTIAGRPVHPLAGIGIRLAVFFALGAVSWQATHFEASTASAAPGPGPVAAAAPSVPAPIAALAAAAAPSDPFASMRRINVGRQLLHGEYVWNEEGAPPGRITMLIDLSAQTLSVFRGGQEIGRAVILYGTEENPTPVGTFSILEKDVDHDSNIYDARMPFMLRLTRDGIAIHASNVRYGSASRGCIGVPHEFAELLFAQARIGDPVTIVPGDPNAAGPPVSPQAVGSDA